MKTIPIGTFIQDNKWWALLSDGERREATHIEIGALPVSGNMTNKLARLLKSMIAIHGQLVDIDYKDMNITERKIFTMSWDALASIAAPRLVK